MEEIFDLYVQRVLPHVAVGIRMRDSSLDLWLERMMICFGDVRGKTVLDFGSGSGHKALLLALCGAEVTAVEIDTVQARHIREASQRIGANVTIVEGGAERLASFPDQAFDRVLLSEIIEHLPVEEVSLLRKHLARILRPGGKLFLTTPNYIRYGPAEEAPEYYRRQPYGHHKHYTLAELRQQFDCTPFRLIAHWLETHSITLWRNRIFYPIARYDYAIQHSRRWPVLRAFLRPFSACAYGIWEACYPISRRLHHSYENYYAAREASGLTIMLDVERY